VSGQEVENDVTTLEPCLLILLFHFLLMEQVVGQGKFVLTEQGCDNGEKNSYRRHGPVLGLRRDKRGRGESQTSFPRQTLQDPARLVSEEFLSLGWKNNEEGFMG